MILAQNLAFRQRKLGKIIPTAMNLKGKHPKHWLQVNIPNKKRKKVLFQQREAGGPLQISRIMKENFFVIDTGVILSWKILRQKLSSKCYVPQVV